MGLREELIKYGIWEVDLEFAASWDETYHTEATLYTASGGTIPAQGLPEALLESLTETLLESLPDEYASEEGSYGNVTFNLLSENIEYDYSERFQDSEEDSRSNLISDPDGDKESGEKTLLEELVECKVSQAIITYDGGGDSGSINDATFYSRDGSVIKIPDHLADSIHEFVIDISLGDIDWYNNEGGYGTVEINVPDNEAILNHNYRIERSRQQSFQKPADAIFADEESTE